MCSAGITKLWWNDIVKSKYQTKNSDRVSEFHSLPESLCGWQCKHGIGLIQLTAATDYNVRVQELKELAALAYRDTTAENREFWKNEMGQALREIHQVYDDKLEGMRTELETYYNLKVNSLQTELRSPNVTKFSL